jgi:type IV pilus assembly protein PilO
MPTSQRDQTMAAIGIVALALAVLYYMYPYKQQAEKLAKSKEHVESLSKANAQAKAEMAKGSANELRAQARLYAENLDVLRQLVPTGNEVPALLEQVSTAARRVGLDIGAVEPEPVIPGDEFDTYRYKITIVGGYHELGSFLTNVGSLTRIIAPVNLKLAPVANAEKASRLSRGGNSVLQSDFEMQTYVAKTSVAPAARDATKGGSKS